MLLRNFFRKKITRDQWYDITNALAKVFEIMRFDFVDGMQEFVTEAPFQLKQKMGWLGMDQSKISLTSELDLRLMAIQLYVMSIHVAQNVYINKEDGREFADMMWKRVAGIDYMELTKFAGYYKSCFSSEHVCSDQINPVYLDLAKHIFNI